MNRPILFSVAVVLVTGAMRAQTNSDSAVAQPSSPAPAVVNTAPASTPAVVQTPPSTSADNTVTQVVYMPKLPTAADLTSAANAQGLTVERIVQTSTQVVAFYRNASGQATSVAYQSLPPSAPAPAVTPAPAPNVVVTAPPPTVVYETAPSVVYYDYPRYYYPRVWYPPVSFSFGYSRGFGGHYHRHR